MASSASASSSAPAAAASAPSSLARFVDLDSVMRDNVNAFASDRQSAALISIKPGNTDFKLDAIFTKKTKDARMRTTLFGGPPTQKLTWSTIGVSWPYPDKYKFAFALEGHVSPRRDVYAYFLVFWRGEHLPALQTPVAFTDKITSTSELTGDQLKELIHSTFPTSTYAFTAMCGCARAEHPRGRPPRLQFHRVACGREGRDPHRGLLGLSS